MSELKNKIMPLEIIPLETAFPKPDTWTNLQDQMIDAMIRFDGALRPRLAKVEV
jgi:hypothetical protein